MIKINLLVISATSVTPRWLQLAPQRSPTLQAQQAEGINTFPVAEYHEQKFALDLTLSDVLTTKISFHLH